MYFDRFWSALFSEIWTGPTRCGVLDFLQRELIVVAIALTPQLFQIIVVPGDQATHHAHVPSGAFQLRLGVFQIVLYARNVSTQFSNIVRAGFRRQLRVDVRFQARQLLVVCSHRSLRLLPCLLQILLGYVQLVSHDLQVALQLLVLIVFLRQPLRQLIILLLQRGLS